MDRQVLRLTRKEKEIGNFKRGSRSGCGVSLKKMRDKDFLRQVWRKHKKSIGLCSDRVKKSF